MRHKLIVAVLMLAAMIITTSADAKVNKITSNCVNSYVPRLCSIHTHVRRTNVLRKKMGQKPYIYRYGAEKHLNKRNYYVWRWWYVHAKTLNRYRAYVKLMNDAVNRWMPTAICESGARWTLNGLYDGGIQFDPGTWRANKPPGYPAYAYQATPLQQVTVGEITAAGAHNDPWPNCPTPGSKFP